MEMDRNRGYVAFPRGLTGWEWYSDLNTRVVFFHLLLTANWEEKRWRGMVIPAGGQVTSLAHLAQETGLSTRQVRTALDHLVATQDVTIATTAKYSVITVNDWLEFTGKRKPEGKRSGSVPPASSETRKNDKVSDKVNSENLCVASPENSDSGQPCDKVTGKQATNNRQTSDNNQTIQTTKTKKPSSSPLPPSREESRSAPEGGTMMATMLTQNRPEHPAQGQAMPERTALAPIPAPMRRTPEQAAPPAAAPTPVQAAPKQTAPAQPTPEQFWEANGLGRASPTLREALDAYRARGVEDALLVAAMREAAGHNAKAPLPYIRTVLDKAVAAGQLTFAAWQAGRSPRGGGGVSCGGRLRVDRATPSGNDFLQNAARRRPLKRAAAPV